ncbi:MAG: riboflavin synthase [Pseudomonadota bacterium]
MFTGIVEGTAKINAVTAIADKKRFVIHTPQYDDVTIGDSIAINGVCLTVTHIDNNGYSFDVVPETLRRSNLGHLKINDIVNIERAMKHSSRIGGHFVQGHVDTVGKIVKWQQVNGDQHDCYLAKINIDPAFSPYLVDKGYITIDGMSITIIETGKHYFTVTFIPHTLSTTIARFYTCGRDVNLETDILGKYIIKYINNNEAYHAK